MNPAVVIRAKQANLNLQCPDAATMSVVLPTVIEVGLTPVREGAGFSNPVLPPWVPPPQPNIMQREERARMQRHFHPTSRTSN
jgi:hypothetical protein